MANCHSVTVLKRARKNSVEVNYEFVYLRIATKVYDQFSEFQHLSLVLRYLSSKELERKKSNKYEASKIQLYFGLGPYFMQSLMQF